MKKALCFIGTLMFSVALMAQTNPASPRNGGQPPKGNKFVGGHLMHGGDRMGTPMGFPFGTWWKSPDIVQQIGLTDDQSQKIDKTFQDFRLKLIDLHATLEKQEALLHDDQVMSQVDKVAQARAALEKANASMMLAIRHVLTPDQWKKLQERAPDRRHWGERPDGPPQRPGGDGGDGEF
jgi:Spy/CpxP family protein refolding chaperone